MTQLNWKQMKRSKKLLLTAVFALGTVFGISAQTTPYAEPTFGIVEEHGTDKINLFTMVPSIEIPLYSKADPALGFSFSWSIPQNCYVGQYIDPQGHKHWSWICYNDNRAFGNSIIAGPNPLFGSYSRYTTTSQCNNGPDINLSGFSLSTPDGENHWVGGIVYGSTSCGPTSMTGTTIDGSGYTLQAFLVSYNTFGWKIWDRSGNYVTGTYEAGGGSTGSPTLENDSFGNSIQLTSQGYTDTLGVSGSFTSSWTGSNWDTTATFAWPVTNGNTTQITGSTSGTDIVSRNLPTYSTSNPYCPQYEYPYGTQPSSFSSSVFSFPDGTNIAFTPERGSGGGGTTTGRIGSFTTRQGATITYTYGTACTFNSTQSPSSYTNNGGYLARTTSDGTTTYTGTGVVGYPSSNSYGPATTTVLDPGMNKTVYNWGMVGMYTPSGPTADPIITQVIYYQNTGSVANPSYTLLKTVTICYNGQTSNCVGVNNYPYPIIERDTYTTLGSMSTSSRVQEFIDSYGNTTSVAKYDFGVSSPTLTSTTGYGTWNGSTCVSIGNNINDKPCDVQMTDNASHIISHTRFSYNSKGSLLTTYVWTGLTWLSNSTLNVYNGNGTPQTTYDLANNPTTYLYDSSKYLECPGCTNFPFPTSISKGGLTTSSTWNGIGAVKLTDVDANQNNPPTQYCYNTGTNCSGTADPFSRVLSVTDPLGNVVYNTYPNGSSPDTTSSTFTFNSGNSVNNAMFTTDGYGRTTSSQAQQGPSSSNYDTVTSSYSWPSAYFQTFTSTPCTAPSGGSCSTGITTLHDVLNRPITVTDPGDDTTNGVSTYTYYASGSNPDTLAVRSPAPGSENTKRVQNEYDGVGRITISCGILSLGGSSCGEHSNSVSGIKTSYSYSATTGSTTTSTTRGSQTKSKTFDALGRLTQTVTPDTGTTQYFWDAAPPICYNNVGWPTPGDLGAKKDNAGRYVCYGYDALHRVTGGLTRPGSGPCFGFVYDSATPPANSGITVNNALGRIVEAYTNNDCNGTTNVVTDEWFSYDKDGNMTDLWESTPNSGMYYHSTATFAGNNIITGVSIANPSESITYGLDGEGRWNSMASSSVTLVSRSNAAQSTTFDAAGRPLYIALGASTKTDYDGYTYSKMGRMKTWTFQVGTTPAQETAVLTWNPLGSLRELSITDGFNSGGTEDCKFGDSSNAGYDDLDRLMRVDCGSGGWGQSYSYDPYGYDDLTKTILSGHTGITFNPTYNTSNNQYASSFGTTYDSNGNVLYDASSTNTYAWNEFGKMKSVNIVGTNCATSGTCVIYDALGRAVEFDSGSQKTEIFYTQSGKAYLNGSTFLRAYWPAPGNGTVLQADAGAFYWEHKDWLGSARISSTIANETIIDDRAYAPFGEVYAEFGSTSQIETIFTGDTQDWVSGMYNTPNRELVANQGRWMSPDPAGAGWNAYAYVTDPNTETDPSGLGQGKGPDPGCSASIRAYCPWQSIFGGMIDLSTLSMQVRVKTGSSLIGVSSDGTVTVGGCGDLSGCQNQEVDTYTDSTIYPFANLTGLFGSGNASKSPAPAANNGKPVPCQDQACELARALRQTGVGTLNSPCTIGGFYLGSAALGAGGAAVANAPEIVAVASENYPTWFNRFVSWLAGKASNPGPVGATGAALGAAYAAGKQFCGSF